MLWMALEQMTSEGVLTRNSRVLHIAPDRGVFHKLSEFLSPDTYETADLFPELFAGFAPDTRRIDLCDLDHEPSQRYDLILHSHVLEHVPCTLAYPLYHLHRMLGKTGRHVFVVPFLGGKSAESFQDMPEEERVRMFQQKDHVRRFGKADIERHLGAILNMPEDPDAERTYGAERLRDANIPARNWRGFTGTTVINLGRDDMKFI